MPQNIENRIIRKPLFCNDFGGLRKQLCIQAVGNGIQEVSGSIPLFSTIEALKTLRFQGFYLSRKIRMKRPLRGLGR
jgi:hypothetical protein